MAGPAGDRLDYFLERVLGDLSRADLTAAVQLADKNVHAPVAERLRRFGGVETWTDFNINTACVYGLTLDDVQLAIYLSTVLPYAGVVVGGRGRRFLGFLDAFDTEPWASEIRNELNACGFLVLTAEQCRRTAPVRDSPSDAFWSYFEVLFEHEVDPPWLWNSE